MQISKLINKIESARVTSYSFLLVALQIAVFSWWGLALAKESPILSDIKNNNQIKVCIWPDYYGITYRNPRTSILQGIGVDLSQSLLEIWVCRSLILTVAFPNSLAT